MATTLEYIKMYRFVTVIATIMRQYISLRGCVWLTAISTFFHQMQLFFTHFLFVYYLAYVFREERGKLFVKKAIVYLQWRTVAATVIVVVYK